MKFGICQRSKVSCLLPAYQRDPAQANGNASVFTPDEIGQRAPHDGAAWATARETVFGALEKTLIEERNEERAMNVKTSRKRREHTTRRQEGRSEEGQSQNRFMLLMAFLSVVFTVGYHSLAQTSGSFSSSGSGSCGSSAPGGTTPSLGGGDQGRVLERILRESLMAGHRSMPEQVGRFLGLGGDAVKAATLWSSMAQVADVRSGEEGDDRAAGMPWRVVDEVFPFEGSAEQNPHSFVYQFQIQVQYTLTPGSAVYVGGACYRNGGAQQEMLPTEFRS